MITTSDCSNTTTRPTVITIDKIKSRRTIFYQLSIGRAAHLTSYVFHNVLSEKTLNETGDISTSNYKPLITVNRPLSTKLSHEELKYMFLGSLHHRANLLEIYPQSLPCTNT